MNFKKKFDYNDINNFLPDNKTIGTTEYFQKKFNNLPSYMCELLEVKSRIEYDDDEIKPLIKMINENRKEEDKKLMDEYEERTKQGEFTEIIISDNVTRLPDAK